MRHADRSGGCSTTSTAERRALLLDCLDRFDAVGRPRLPGLRTQAIHNDFSGDNVLVDETPHGRRHPRLRRHAL